MNQHIKMKCLPESEQPYEKYAKYGVEQLSDAELLAILIRNGTKDLSSLDVARNFLMMRHGNLMNLFSLSHNELLQIPGIGNVKAMELKALAELSKRIAKTESGFELRLDSPSSIAKYYMELRYLPHEVLVVAVFDSKCHFLGDERVSVGSTSYTYVSPKDILRSVLMLHGATFVVLHNHPSGDATPSLDDKRITMRIKECAELMDLTFSDHIIIGDNQYFSFLEHQLLN